MAPNWYTPQMSGCMFARLDAINAVELPGTEGAMAPFFSPDGQWIGFLARPHLKKVPISGGAVVSICAVADPIGANWGPDNTILIGAVYAGILRVSANGGNPAVVIHPSPSLAYLHRSFCRTASHSSTSAAGPATMILMSNGDAIA